MRPIKFRAWHFNDKEMVYNVYLYPGNMVVDEDDKVIGHLGIDVYLMQSTGLLDKNGKEIYEGDIVSDGVHSYEMIWCEGLYGWMYDDTYSGNLFTPNEIIGEIVGNIYKNPELIDRYTIHC